MLKRRKEPPVQIRILEEEDRAGAEALLEEQRQRTREREETRAAIFNAPDHKTAAEIAVSFNQMWSDGRFVFGELAVAHAMLALVDELREE